MTEKDIKLYFTSTCPYCHMAKEYFSEKGIKYEEYNVGENREKAMEMINVSGQRGVPVITVGEEVIVGFNKNRLEELLGE